MCYHIFSLLLQAVAVVRHLTACSDFHDSLLPLVCQAAAKAAHPAVSKEALSAAVQALVKPGATGSVLPAGQEAALLLGYVQSIGTCLDAAEDADAGGAGGSGALYAELVAAVKLVVNRLRLLGWDKFTGAASQVKLWEGWH